MGAIEEFARLAANALTELASPTASAAEVAESLAALEHQLYSLHGEQRYAASSLARALCRLSSGCTWELDIERALCWTRSALRWQHMDDLIEIGRCLERAACVLDLMEAREQRHQRELLRMTVAVVESDIRGTTAMEVVRAA